MVKACSFAPIYLRCAVLAQKNKELQCEFDQCKEQLPKYQERLLMIWVYIAVNELLLAVNTVVIGC